MTWRIDVGVARDVADLIGWSPADDAVRLTRALLAAVPAGSTAKIAAVAAGELPPGADPEAVARRILVDRAAGRPEPAWACWPMSTLMAALVTTLTDRTAQVVGIRSISPTAAPVDVHSLVAVDGLLCDPYFASAVAGPGAEETERLVDGVWSRRTDEADGRWTLEVGNGRWGTHLTYRVLMPVMDRGDVTMWSRVAVDHSGAPPWNLGFVWDDERCVEASTLSDGATRIRTWRWASGAVWEGTLDEVELADWPEAAAAFAERTGIPLL